MGCSRIKSLLVAAFSLISLVFSGGLQAQQDTQQVARTDSSISASNIPQKEEKSFDPAKVILEHVSDGHEFHFAVIGEKYLTIPLPVIVYSEGKGWSFFMS